MLCRPIPLQTIPFFKSVYYTTTSTHNKHNAAERSIGEGLDSDLPRDPSSASTIAEV